MFYGLFYILFLIPSYRGGNNIHRFVLRAGLHPMLLIFGDGLLRTFAIRKHTKSTTPAHLRSLHITVYDLMFQLIGRTFMAMDMDNSTFSLFCTVIVGIQEYIIR